MPLSAQYLVRRTRELLQLFGDEDTYRDGFPADSDTDPTPILPAVNEYVSTLARTGYFRTDFTLNAVSGTGEYQVDQKALKVYGVYYAGKALDRRTRDGMDADNKAWRTLTPGTPTRYIREGRRLILIPTPSETAAGRIVYTASRAEDRLTDTSSTFSYIPEAMQDRLPYGSALMLTSIDAEHPVHGKRVQLYQAIAASVLSELSEIGDGDDMDWATPVSADNWVAPRGGPQLRRGVMSGASAPIGATRGGQQ